MLCVSLYGTVYVNKMVCPCNVVCHHDCVIAIVCHWDKLAVGL